MKKLILPIPPERCPRQFLSFICIAALSSSGASAAVVFLADSATVTGGSVNQPFTNTVSGTGFSGGNTIVSGATNLNDALNYTIAAQGATGGGINGRFTGGSFGTVQYNFTAAKDLGGVLLWNYNETFSGVSYNERGLVRADLTITHAGGTTVLQDVAFTLTPETGGAGQLTGAQQIDWGTTYMGVTAVSFSDLQGGDPTFVGWQRFAAVEGVPEPTVALLGGLGFLTLLRRRR